MASSLFQTSARDPQQRNLQNSGGINRNAIQSVKRMMSTFRAAKNPNAALQAMAQQNPLIGNIMQVCGPGGLQKSFYRLCQEQGVNPEDVLREIM